MPLLFLLRIFIFTLGNVIFQCVFFILYLVLQLFNIITLKRHIPIQHSKQHHSCTPQIDWATWVTFFRQNFRCNISWSPALVCQNHPWLCVLAYSEISNLYMTFRVQEDVVQLYIAMDYVLWVYIADSLYDLFEEELGYSFIEFPSFPYIGKQVSSGTQFHHKQVVFFSLEGFE